jgi:hypothetical protein
MTLQEIFEQARRVRKAVRLRTPTSDSMIYRGIKIEKTEDRVVIYNTRLSGDFYKEISQQEYEVFYRYGFLFGVYTICIQNYRVILNKLAVKIRNEVGNRNNQRHYNALKQYRNTVMNKFTDTLKLIQDENRRQLQD